MAWINPVPDGIQTRGFAPASTQDAIREEPMYADGPLRRAHPPGAGSFPDARYYPEFHAALDIAAPAGTPILAPESGVVIDAEWGGNTGADAPPGSWAGGGGWFFRIAVNDECMYLGAHCSELLVNDGDHVRKGEVIARVGSTGVATGNHLHFWVRLGPKPYYDPAAFFYNPVLVLPGGPLHGDIRFAPGYDELPDTGTPDFRVDGDPAPMRFRSEVQNGRTIQRTLRARKPIRASASVNSRVLKTFFLRRELDVIGRIPKEQLPAAERPFGDVLITPVYVGSGHVLGYVKQVDLAGN